MLWIPKISILAGALLVLQSILAFVDGLRFLRLIRRSQDSPPGSYTPSAAVVIPCKGTDSGFEANVDRFLNQDYPSYQVVFVVATQADTAYPALQARLDRERISSATRKCAMFLVVAGLADGRGEKVNNLLHGVASADPSVRVFVFADIDATPSPDWLRSVVAPLANPQVTVSTGFRWYLPGNGFASRLRAAWDTSIATMMGDCGRNFAWGGSMAMRAADFRALGIAERYWQSTVSDDYALTRAVREAGGKIVFAPRCLLASREESSLREFLRWSTRQIIITRVYASHLWRLGLAAYLFYCGTLTLGVITVALPATTGYERITVAAMILAVLLLGAGKGYIRSLVARRLFAKESAGRESCYWQLSPLVPWIMLGNFLAARFTRRIDWRGTEYALVSKDEVRVLGRSDG